MTRVAFRATEEPDLYSIMLGGKVNVDRVVADREEFVRMVKIGTGRADIPLGNIRVISIFRCVYHPSVSIRYY